MFSSLSIIEIADYVLFISCLFLLLGCVLLTIKTRFVQIRFIPKLYSFLMSSIRLKGQRESGSTILPHKALFTAMSTTLGLATIVAPVIAMNLGGPGALLGFLVTAFFGSAATFTEINLSIQHRKKLDNGVIMGGPMQYLKALFSPGAAVWYAACCTILMPAWSAAQANQMAAILHSPLLGDYQVPMWLSGGVIAILVLTLLFGGIKRIGSFSLWIVPAMFVIYVGSCLWIVIHNLHKLGDIFDLIYTSAISAHTMASGVAVGGIVSSLRWGIFKGIQCCEAGVGTQAIPHSMADTQHAEAQAAMGMLSTYTAGCLAFLSGCVALITNTWQDPLLPLGMSMVAASFEMYFSSFGIAILAVTTLLFAFGTILGNCYNGSQSFGYLSQNKKIRWYFVLSAFLAFIGAISDVKTVWSVIDLILACMALPHMAALVYHAYRQPEESPSMLRLESCA